MHDAGLAEGCHAGNFLRLYKHQDSITDSEMLRPWLIRVAINVAKNTFAETLERTRGMRITSKRQAKRKSRRSRSTMRNTRALTIFIRLSRR
ncbi:MAG: hypothetical protein IPO41_13785 [Acidobacteria bacterium]|nr:hypothetical protein [Acidobacteriota bacterium]